MTFPEVFEREVEGGMSVHERENIFNPELN
jgi:hypothetical protein